MPHSGESVSSPVLLRQAGLVLLQKEFLEFRESASSVVKFLA